MEVVSLMPYQHLQGNSNLGCFGCGRNCGCTGLKTSAAQRLGEFAATGEFSETEREMVASAISKILESSRQPGARDVNQLSDNVFFARYPVRNNRLIDPKTEPNLAEEWKDIKTRLVLPILGGLLSNQKGKEAMFANQFLHAAKFFDRARRVSISPAEKRAGATFNLGVANLKLKRLAAAIGYFEIVRTYPGISAALKAKAEKTLMHAKQEYQKAVP